MVITYINITVQGVWTLGKKKHLMTFAVACIFFTVYYIIQFSA